ncbi:hypothetical protein, partial [Candidatus Aquicultor secundus]
GSSGCGACHNTNSYLEGINTDTAAPVADAADNGRAAITWLFASMLDFASNFDAASIDALFAPGSWPEPAASNYAPLTMYELTQTSNGYANEIAASLLTTPTPNGTDTAILPKIVGQLKSSRTVDWSASWRDAVDPVSATCADDGLSFPHRTLGWKMLKDDLFGIDIGISGDSTGAAGQDSEVVGAGESRQGAYGNGVAAHDVDSVCLDCHNPTVWGATSSSNHTDTGGNTIYNDDVIQRGLP